MNFILKKCKQIYKSIFWRRKYHFCSIGKSSYVKPKCRLVNPQYVSIGENSIVLQDSRLECYDNYAGTHYNPTIIIGNNVTIGKSFTCLSAAKVEIGNDCLIASFVLITNLNHGTNPQKIYNQEPLTSHDVKIGRNCWIGEKAIILPGVVIGDNCIIGAGSVVTKNIPSNTISVGNPARVIKKYDFKIQKWITALRNNGEEII